MSTASVTSKNIRRNWHFIDSKGQVLGRLATEVAKLLMGKHKPNFVPYLDNGDFVVLTNIDKVKISGKKSAQKKYVTHSGFPGGLKVDTFDKLIVSNPDRVIKHAISGMLPKNKLADKMIKRLKTFTGENHPFEKQTKKEE